MTVPKKPPVLCRGGHQQSPKWRQGDDCWQCIREEQQRLLHDPAVAAAFRAQELAKLGPLPEVMTIRPRYGKAITFTTTKPKRRR